MSVPRLNPDMGVIYIPIWYRRSMSTQIAVRLPDDMVKFLDRLVADGQAASRASVIERALAREIRRQIAARDAAILAGAGPDPDMDSLASYAAGTPLDIG
jgi:Arc/MetJ-type ribon-helix-helix transcriptional regulator